MPTQYESPALAKDLGGLPPLFSFIAQLDVYKRRSTKLVPLIHKIRWNILGERGGISVISFVDVGADVLDDFVGLRVGFALFFHPVDRVEDGGVIPVVELLADVLQGEFGHVPRCV